MELLGAGARVLQVLEREVSRIDLPQRNETGAQRVQAASSRETVRPSAAVPGPGTDAQGVIVVNGAIGHDDEHRNGTQPGMWTIAGYLTLAGHVEQVGTARAFVRKLLAGDPLLDAALLVVSELVSNSVQHSRSSLPGGTVTVYVLHVGNRARIEVLDDGAEGVPCMRPTGGAELPDWAGVLNEVDLRGRGLRLVDVVAACWDFTIGHRRTTTWAELAPAEDPGSPA
ncbi:ATP-binding protein [Sphaerisporangium sp. NPDC088356]|uniref:ATP-binding protein n=1 Tax=Sphaerisporangium sp. NPDC088356 TaxID=3154871 RepID=UPI003437233B